MTEDLKARRAAAARAAYAKNAEVEQMRKFLSRVAAGSKPSISSMDKFGLDLPMINTIRNDHGLDPLKPDQVKGHKKEKQQVLAANKRSKDEIRNSVVPSVDIPERAPEMKVNRKMMTDNPDTKVTLEYYLECLSTKVVKKSLNNYQRYLTMILENFGYKDGDSIIPILKKFDQVSNFIENEARQLSGKDKGKPYQPVTRKLFWQSISTGLVKDYCIAYSSQMPKDTAQKYITTTSIKNSKDQERRRAETQKLDLPDWVDKIQPIAKEFIDSDENSLLDKALIQVYTQLGGVPRTGTFLNLHKVNNIKLATDKNKNYIVIKRDKAKKSYECTIISNVHKTGVNEGKSGGTSIVLALHKKYKPVMKNLISLSKDTNKVFGIRQDYLNKLLQRVFSHTNQKLRKMHESWVQNKGSLDDIIRASYVNAHTIATARSYYAKLEEDVDDKKIETLLNKMKDENEK